MVGCAVSDLLFRPISVEFNHHQRGIMKKHKTYGSWESPITASKVASDSTGLSEVRVHNGDVYWLELRPSEGGRMVVVKWSEEVGVSDIIPEGYNARSRVHEYGGGSYHLVGDDVYFVNFEDQRVYRKAVG